MAGVLSLAISRALQKAAVERDIARFGDVSPRLSLFRRCANSVQGKCQLVLR